MANSKAKEEKKTAGQLLMEELSAEFPNIAKKAPEMIPEAQRFCEGYKRFLDEGKTERECVRASEALAKKAGYRPFECGRAYAAGEKVYSVNRGKSIIFSTIGRRPLAEGVHFNIAHIDSPRLDLKPKPLYEEKELSYFKTHYYGGIRKYQWGVIPLAMHGRVVKKDGTYVDLNLGENEGDPVFVITDLLPHLAAKQNERTLREGLKAEELNVLLGSEPFQDEKVKEAVKLRTLEILNETYGITERDFLRAEIEIVPAYKAKDVGFDRSMIGAYGQDDRVCAYTALMAEIDCEKPEYTTVTVLVDKEETGSIGNTGMSSDMLLHYLEDLADTDGSSVRELLRHSLCLSADVNAAFDPTFPDVYDPKNSCYINRGPVLTKYTGRAGKAVSNDASAETMAKMIGYLEAEGVFWQIGELGKVDEGGGGTIARFICDMDVDVVDLGVPVLAMHAPFEITAKLDVYYMYRAFAAFNR